MLGAGFVHYVLSAMLPLLTQLIGTAMGQTAAGSILSIGNLLEPGHHRLLAAFAVELYLDLRVRSEGLIQLEADRPSPCAPA